MPGKITSLLLSAFIGLGVCASPPAANALWEAKAQGGDYDPVKEDKQIRIKAILALMATKDPGDLIAAWADKDLHRKFSDALGAPTQGTQEYEYLQSLKSISSEGQRNYILFTSVALAEFMTTEDVLALSQHFAEGMTTKQALKTKAGRVWVEALKKTEKARLQVVDAVARQMAVRAVEEAERLDIDLQQ